MADRGTGATPDGHLPTDLHIDPAMVLGRLQEQAAVLAQLEEQVRVQEICHQTRGAASKIPKPESFDGKRDPVAVDQWLYQLGHYLVLQGTPVDQQVRCAAMYLKGLALLWWLQREEQVARGEAAPFMTLDDFVGGVRHQFAPVHARVAARDLLATLVQKTMVAAYIEVFLTVVLAIPGMTEEENIDKFTRRLRGQAPWEVRVRQCNTLQEAMILATRVDSVFIERGWQRDAAEQAAGWP